jgi:hypothetical protein
MPNQIDLKEIERKAFRSTYQDGLWDILYGLVIVSTAIFVYRPDSGYTPMNIVLAVLMIVAANVLFQAGKRFITLPRLGQVRFGPRRQQRKRTLALVMGLFVLLQIGMVSFSVLGWLDPDLGARINSLIKDRDVMDLLVASIGALFVGPSMILVAYFSDFPRGYYIAVMLSLAVFLIIWLNQPVFPILIGSLVILPGVVLFIRFLQEHPLPSRDAAHE